MVWVVAAVIGLVFLVSWAFKAVRYVSALNRIDRMTQHAHWQMDSAMATMTDEEADEETHDAASRQWSEASVRLEKLRQADRYMRGP